MRRASVILALAAASAAAAEAQKGQVLLDDCDYATTQAARAVWRPIDPASPGVEVVTAADRRMLKLPCNFATNEQWRVGWDRSGQWDLSACSEIFLSVAAGHPDVHRGGARMSLYLRSGGGWYGRSFEVPPGSSTVRLARKSFSVQGKPAGWERIDGVRLCVLRDEGADRAVLVAGLGAIEKKAHVAVYRNDAGVKDEGGVGRYAQLAVDALDRLGIACDLVDDKAVAAGRLAGKQVAVLPLNPVLPADAAAAVRNFVAGGGKLLVCYRLPEPLGELLDIRLAGRLDGKDGQLAGIVFQGREDRPKVQAAQHSWIAHRIVPGRGAKVVGHWVDRAGKVTDLPAVTRNENGYFVGHVFTEHAPSAKDRLLLEMLGQLWPAAWEEVARHRLEALGRAAGL
ncbi:MAG: hypothetical protein AMJ81_00600, partial [Phycisphaerae bacterium SM23_33]